MVLFPVVQLIRRRMQQCFLHAWLTGLPSEFKSEMPVVSPMARGQPYAITMD